MSFSDLPGARLVNPSSVQWARLTSRQRMYRSLHLERMITRSPAQTIRNRCLPFVQSQLKELGAAVASYKRDELDENDLVDLVNDIPFIWPQYAADLMDKITSSDYCLCGNCLTLVNMNDTEDTTSDGQVCQNCINEHCAMPEDGDAYERTDRLYASRSGGYYLEEPRKKGLGDYHDHPERDNRIRYHSPTIVKGCQELYVGVEWEMLLADEDDRENAAINIDELDFAVAEEDGSLDGETGMEVVTGWTTLSQMNDWIQTIYRATRPEGNENCGLHVNISGLTRQAKYRYLYFMNTFRDFHRPIVGRWGNTYSEPHEFTDVSQAEEYYDGRDYSKYRNVYPHGQNYVEVRMYKGALNAEVTRSRVQHAYACAMYCQSTTIGEPSPEDFAAWLLKCEDLQEVCSDFITLHKTHLESYAKRSVKREWAWVTLDGTGDMEIGAELDGAAADAANVTEGGLGSPVPFSEIVRVPVTQMGALVGPEVRAHVRTVTQNETSTRRLVAESREGATPRLDYVGRRPIDFGQLELRGLSAGEAIARMADEAAFDHLIYTSQPVSGSPGGYTMRQVIEDRTPVMPPAGTEATREPDDSMTEPATISDNHLETTSNI